MLSDLDLRLQILRNSSRCQRRTVSGRTMRSDCFQVRSLEASKTKSARSRQESAGLFVCRLSTVSCWRSRAFSSTNSVLLRARSRAVLRTGASLSGFVQRRRRCLTAWQRERMPCRTREKNEKSIACLSRQRMEATILSQIETMGHNSQADEVFGHHSCQRGDLWAAVSSGHPRARSVQFQTKQILQVDPPTDSICSLSVGKFSANCSAATSARCPGDSAAAHVCSETGAQRSERYRPYLIVVISEPNGAHSPEASVRVAWCCRPSSRSRRSSQRASVTYELVSAWLYPSNA